MKKIAVVVFNLGGPDSQESIRPFLKNFFMDKNIIQAPRPIRDLISSLIAWRRSGKQAGSAYAALGYKSPLLGNTKQQAAALERFLKNAHPETEWKTFIAMRYWHPLSHEIARAVLAWEADEIVLLPLYPQFSTTTTGSSVEDWVLSAQKAGLTVKTRTIGCYPLNGGFTKASAALIMDAYERARTEQGDAPRLLFSAHGLPEKIIEGGDPYQWQCEESARRIAAATGIPDLDWEICYQSRVGPLRWIGPSTEEALHKAARDHKAVLVYPHAFVSEHVETLVEIETEYRHLAKTLGIPGFYRVPTVSTHPAFIEGLAEEVVSVLSDKPRPHPICPDKFGRCFCRALA